MLATVIDQWDVIQVEKPAVQTQTCFAFCNRYANVIVRRAKAIADLNLKRFPSFCKPIIFSTTRRYIQLAEPVYQVQPPRLAWEEALHTSAATMHGSTR
jgi:hypothetical protein